ncbi:biopolymer transporter ExbD [soil metagenome]
MRFRESIKAEGTGFQLAPMIDIVFLLLIFFIVTWSYARFETELDISVPAAEEGQPPDRQVGEIIVNVRKNGEIVLNGVTLTTEQLLQKLLAVSNLRKDQAVILRGDIQATYEDIVRVLDTCKSANIWNVAFATSHPIPPEAAPPTPPQ